MKAYQRLPTVTPYFHFVLPTFELSMDSIVGSLLYHQHHILYTSTVVVRKWFPLKDEVWNGKLFLYCSTKAKETSENLIMILSLPIFYLGILFIPRQNWFWSLFQQAAVSFLFCLFVVITQYNSLFDVFELEIRWRDDVGIH